MDPDTLDSYNNFAREYSNSRAYKQIHNLVEKPAMYPLIPDAIGDALSIGCGSGEELLEMSKKEYMSITAVDMSYGMLMEAKKNYGFIPGVDFLNCDFYTLSSQDKKYDFIYSSLVLHYMKDFKVSIEHIAKLLKPSGCCLFSINHPIRSSFGALESNGERIKGLGYCDKVNHRKYFGDYFSMELRKERWFEGKFHYNYYHHTFSNIIDAVVTNKLTIITTCEPSFPAGIDLSGEYNNKYPPVLIIKLAHNIY